MRFPTTLLVLPTVLLLFSTATAAPAENEPAKRAAISSTLDKNLLGRNEDIKPLPCDSEGQCLEHMVCKTEPELSYCVFDLKKDMAKSTAEQDTAIERDTTSTDRGSNICHFRPGDCPPSQQCGWNGFDFPTCAPNVSERGEDAKPKFCTDSSVCPRGEHCKYSPQDGYPICYAPNPKSERDEDVPGPLSCFDSSECFDGEHCQWSDRYGYPICVAGVNPHKRNDGDHSTLSKRVEDVGPINCWDNSDCFDGEHCRWSDRYEYPICVAAVNPHKRDDGDKPCIDSSACPPGDICKYNISKGYPICVVNPKPELDMLKRHPCPSPCPDGEICVFEGGQGICTPFRPF